MPYPRLPYISQSPDWFVNLVLKPYMDITETFFIAVDKLHLVGQVNNTMSVLHTLLY
jgi:hypothetical protein